MMAGTLISPKLDIQVRKRQEMYKKRQGSPSFKEILRERCQARIKAKRGALFEKLRYSPKELHNIFNGMLQEEVKELTAKPLPPMETMEIEDRSLQNGEWYLTPEEQYLLEEYEKVLAEEEALFGYSWEDHVICPMCERAVLQQTDSNEISCPGCMVHFSYATSLKNLKQNINEGIRFHMSNCSEPSQFAVIIENLFLICEICGCWYQIA